MSASPRVAFLPASAAEHPYLRALGASLEEVGVSVVGGFRFRVGPLLSRRREVNVLHLHWPGYFYLTTRSAPGTALRLAVYVAKLVLARLLGYRIVWTVHNLLPHEGPRWAGRADRRALGMLAHGVICHCHAAAEAVRPVLGPAPATFVIPHGPLPGGAVTTLDAGSRDRARAFFRIPPDTFLYLFVGEIRPYKGVEELIDVFRRRPPAAELLLVAGAPRSPELAAGVRRAAEGSRRVRALLRRLPEHRLTQLVHAADAVVLPYRRVTTSGLLHLAIAVGARIVAPASGCIPEAVDDRFAALYPPDDPQGLARALDAVRRLDGDKARAACHARAAESGWDRIAALTRRAYEGVLAET